MVAYGIAAAGRPGQTWFPGRSDITRTAHQRCWACSVVKPVRPGRRTGSPSPNKGRRRISRKWRGATSITNQANMPPAVMPRRQDRVWLATDWHGALENGRTALSSHRRRRCGSITLDTSDFPETPRRAYRASVTSANRLLPTGMDGRDEAKPLTRTAAARKGINNIKTKGPAARTATVAYHRGTDRTSAQWRPPPTVEPAAASRSGVAIREGRRAARIMIFGGSRRAIIAGCWMVPLNTVQSNAADRRCILENRATGRKHLAAPVKH